MFQLFLLNIQKADEKNNAIINLKMQTNCLDYLFIKFTNLINNL